MNLNFGVFCTLNKMKILKPLNLGWIKLIKFLVEHFLFLTFDLSFLTF